VQTNQIAGAVLGCELKKSEIIYKVQYILIDIFAAIIKTWQNNIKLENDGPQTLASRRILRSQKDGDLAGG
jgi:hypothetical protein